MSVIEKPAASIGYVRWLMAVAVVLATLILGTTVWNANERAKVITRRDKSEATQTSAISHTGHVVDAIARQFGLDPSAIK